MKSFFQKIWPASKEKQANETFMNARNPNNIGIPARNSYGGVLRGEYTISTGSDGSRSYPMWAFANIEDATKFARFETQYLDEFYVESKNVYFEISHEVKCQCCENWKTEVAYHEPLTEWIGYNYKEDSNGSLYHDNRSLYHVKDKIITEVTNEWVREYRSRALESINTTKVPITK